MTVDLKAQCAETQEKQKQTLKPFIWFFFLMGCAAALVCIVHYVSSVSWFIKH